MTKEAKTVWLVPHPTYVYVENVKAIAKEHGLQVIDEAQAGPEERKLATDKPPKLTLVGADQTASKRDTAPGSTKSKGA